MSESQVTFAVIGLGRAGWDIHVKQLLEEPRAKIVAVVDPQPQRRDEAAAKLNCETFATYDEALEQTSAEVIVLATPSAGHEAETLQAIASGRHVVVEKPMALNSIGARRMVETAAKSGKHLFPFQNYRFRQDFVAVQRAVATGRLGTITHIRRYPFTNFNRRNDWQTLARNGGGLLNVHGSHHVDLLLQILPGRVTDVWGDLRRLVSAGDVEDHVKIVLRTDTGATADVELSMAQNVAMPLPHWIIAGTNGTLTSDDKTVTTRWFDPAAAPALAINEVLHERRYGNPETLPWQEEKINVPDVKLDQTFYSNVVDVLRHDAQPAVTPQSVLELIETLERVRAAAR